MKKSILSLALFFTILSAVGQATSTLNAFTKDRLKVITPGSYTVAILYGDYATRPISMYVYDTASTETADNENVIITNSTPTKGRWVKWGKMPRTYSGETDSSGEFTVVFDQEYDEIPNVQASISPQTNTNQFVRVSDLSTTGFTVHVFERSYATLLGIDVLLSAVSDIEDAGVDVVVLEN